MAAFNINFGQKNIENAQKSRELSLRDKQIEYQRRAAEAQAFAQASSSSGFRNAVNASRANDLRERELALREERMAHDQSWSDLLNQQKMEESALRMENLRKSSEKYDLALESDRAAVEEATQQARERQRLLNSELGTLYLSAYKNGGAVSPSQRKAFNDTTGEQFDFLGNSADIPLQNGRVVHQQIGDGKGFYMGKFERDQRGNIVFGKDGTPVTSMVEMPRDLQQTILRSAYGKDYLGGSRGGMSDERMQLERDRLAESRRHNQAREENERARIASNQEKADNAARLRVGTMINPMTGQPTNPEVLNEIKSDLDKSRKAKQPQQAQPVAGQDGASSSDNTKKTGMSFEKGQEYTDRSGKTMRFLGGDYRDRNNWEEVDNATEDEEDSGEGDAGGGDASEG